MILGGQISGEAMRMFLVYSAGNFIEATRETCYFQIGESKYGKPVLDRLLTPEASLEDGTKCALLSMDETMKSNLSVGLPIDLAVYREGTLQRADIICIDEHNPYFAMVHSTWPPDSAQSLTSSLSSRSASQKSALKQISSAP